MRSETVPEGQERRSFIDEARRQQIVAAAIDTLAEEGFARTSLAAIARRAGVSKGVISYHFAGKSELIEQVIARVISGESAFFEQLKAEETSGPEKLHYYVERTIGTLKTERKLVRALTEIFLNFRKQDGTTFYDASTQEPAIAALEAIFREGQAAGDFGAFSPRVMAMSLRAVLDALPLQLALHPDIDLDDYCAEIITLFERATCLQTATADKEETEAS